MKKAILVMIILLATLQIACKEGPKKEIAEIEEPGAISMEVASEDKTIINRSEDLSDFIVELFGVDDAATIIFNDTALVGVIMAYDSELTDDIKGLINDIVLEQDKGIKQVVISDDEKVFNEVANIINELMSGKSYDGYVNSINKMIEKNK